MKLTLFKTSSLNKHQCWSLFCLLYAMFLLTYSFDLRDFYISLAIYLVLQNLGVGIALHRYLSHNSFSVSPWTHKYLVLFSALPGVGSPLIWAAMHRSHHDNADTPKDPHSPYFNSLVDIVTGECYKKTISRKYISPLLKDKYLLFFHKNYYLSLFILFSIIYLSFGFKTTGYIFILPILLCNLITSLGIILNHTEGYRNFITPDRSRNSLILNLLTFGDGWHNNHHKFPNKYKHGYRFWELDPQGWIINLIRLKV